MKKTTRYRVHLYPAGWALVIVILAFFILLTAMLTGCAGVKYNSRAFMKGNPYGQHHSAGGKCKH